MDGFNDLNEKIVFTPDRHVQFLKRQIEILRSVVEDRNKKIDELNKELQLYKEFFESSFEN